MQNLINFLYKYAHFIFFILLLSFSFYLIVANNNYHNTKFISSSNRISGNILEQRSNIIRYFQLANENDSLIIENKMLRSKIELFKYDSIIPLKDNVEFNYTTGRIVGASKNLEKNYLTINVGKKSEVYPDMGVISPQGVVGIVIRASNNFATVLPLINTNSRISVKLKDKEYFGSLVWNGRCINHSQVHQIPGYADINIGDKVVTSGFSALFPENIPVGEVVGYTKDKAIDFYIIDIKLYHDFNKIYNVYVIKSLFAEEKMELEEIDL